MNKVEILINVLTIGEEFIFQLEQLKGMSDIFNPKLKHHSSKTVFQFEKATKKLFKEIEDADAVMGLYDIQRELFAEISKLSIARKYELLAKIKNENTKTD